VNASPAPPIWWQRLVLLLAWIFAVACAGQRLHRGWTGFDNQEITPRDRWRDDGNSGHAEIDFGAQWVMGRMIATGNGKHLYDRTHLWPVVEAGFPPTGESPWVRRESFPRDPRIVAFSDGDPRHDSGWMMSWILGADSSAWPEASRAVALPFANPANPFATAALVLTAHRQLTPELVEAVNRKSLGGPLYPPVHAFFYYPLGRIDDAQTAFHVLQILSFLCPFAIGFCVRNLTNGRVWWPIATAIVCLYPGYRGTMELGQNAQFTLLILVWGWCLAAKGHELGAGAVWGLLAFKPVWAVAFLLVPLVLRRWRMLFGMVASGGGLVLLTLPFVGIDAYFDWLAVGGDAAEKYKVNQNWVFLSRDLFGIPRRILLDFTLPDAKRDRVDAERYGWLLWGFVFVGTGIICTIRRDRRDFTAGFAMLGAFLCSYRFMYYDVLLSALGVGWIVYCHDWRRRRISFPTVVLCFLVINENLWAQRSYAIYGTNWNTGIRYPIDTLMVLALWLWMAARLLMPHGTPRSASSAEPMSGERISDSPTSTA